MEFQFEEAIGKGGKLESLLAARLMRESTLLVRTLLSYATRTRDSEGLYDSTLSLRSRHPGRPQGPLLPVFRPREREAV
jgi:hypothetical protein